MKIIIIVFCLLIFMALVWTIGQYWYVNVKLEKPNYTVVSTASDYEIRDYEPYIVASVTVDQNNDSLNSGFRLVADYIFGNNTKDGSSESVAMTAPVIDTVESSESIAMTTPVINHTTQAGKRTVSFVMPSQYSLETLPRPNNSSVSLEQVPSQRWAVLSYSGLTSDEDIQEKLNTLISSLERDNVAYTQTWQSARYDPPSTLPMLRTNEIWVLLEQ